MGNDPKKPAAPAPTLNPTFVTPLWRAALDAPSHVMTLTPHPQAGTRMELNPPTASFDVEAARARFFGPAYAALSHSLGDDATLDDLLRAESAFSVVPALLIASAARPATDTLYGVVDRIPDAIRRPFHKALGLLIDSGLALASDAAQSLLDESVRGFAPGSKLPDRVELPVDGYSQLDSSCGETAVATILKAAGEPVFLDDVDTQLPGPFGIPGVAGVPGVAGYNLQVDREYARRGLTAISLSTDLPRLKQFVASGMPVAVNVGWSNGGGHYAVVSGFDQTKRTLTIQNWHADGKAITVSETDFDVAWARHMRMMSAVSPRRDPRLAKLIAQGELRRPSNVSKGVSLSDFWVDKKRVYVELAYRYVTADTDATVRVSFNSEGLGWSDTAAAQWLNGSIAVRQRVAAGWHVGFRVNKLSVRGDGANEWSSLRTTPIAAGLTVEGPGFELSVATERGGVQGSLGVALAKRIADLGLKVNVSVDAEGRCNVQGVVAGTW